MGVSDKWHFDWILEVSKSERTKIMESFNVAKEKPVALGIGEHQQNPFLKSMFDDILLEYIAADAFPRNEKVIKLDINNLQPLFGKFQADIITCFRTSFFISDKNTFFEHIPFILKSGGWLVMDFLLGNSNLPTIKWDGGGGAVYDKTVCSFKTTFFDDRLIKEFPEEVGLFCKHSKKLPIAMKIKHFVKHRQLYKASKSLPVLKLEELSKAVASNFPDNSIISLKDFEKHGFEIIKYQARYFYPYVGKFNIFNFVIARNIR